MIPGAGTLWTLQLSFDPYFHLDSAAVRWETLGAAVAILAGLAWAALIAGRTPSLRAWIGEGGDGEEAEGPWHLRRDDLLFIVLGAIPGALVLGRAGYGLLHADYYGANLPALLDPAQGSLDLTGAVVGGTLTGAYVAALLDAPVGRWLHVAIKPLLLTLLLAKASQILGGSGQGLPSDLPWATAFAGTGPWGSPAPDVSAHPAQLYEALAGVLVLVVVSVLGAWSGLRRADGRLFAVGIGLWALSRCAVASSWRDPTVLGPFRAEQLICLAVAALAFSLAIMAILLGRAKEE